jgi:23S rRNA (guanosine2251-2'-O)-methyltransferase
MECKMPQGDTIYGINPVLEVLRSGRRRCLEVLVAEGLKDANARQLEGLAARKGVKLSRVKKEEIGRRAGTTSHQGVAARVDPYPYAELEDVVTTALKDDRKAFLVILDGITDPHNMGSIIRTAHLLGVHGVIVPKDNSCPITPAVVKASAGATEYLPVVQVTNIAHTVNLLKDKGIWIAAAEGDSETSVYDNDFAGYHFAVVLGSEGKGVRRLVRERSDFLVNIPMEGEVGSFNVSVAGALIMGEIARQRRGK